MQQFVNYLLFALVVCVCITSLRSQTVELVGLELAKPPTGFKNAPPYNFGTKLTFFVNDSAAITGLTGSYKMDSWVTNSVRDLKTEHRKLVVEAVKQNYRVAKDTALLPNRGFWVENGLGFTFKLHSWALPDSLTSSMKIKGAISYTVLVPGEVAAEDITHLAGNFGFETLSMDFKGNTIELKKVVYGRGDDAYTTFSGEVLNNNHEFAIQNMQFLDFDGKVLDELYFGLNNQYGTNTRKQIDLTGTSVIRIQYRKIKVKKVFFNEIIAFAL